MPGLRLDSTSHSLRLVVDFKNCARALIVCQPRFKHSLVFAWPTASHANVLASLKAVLPLGYSAHSSGLKDMQVPNVAGRIEEGKKAPKKNMAITLFGLWGRNRESPLLPEVYTPSGWPAVSTPVLRSLAGKPGVAKAALDQLRGAVSGNEGGELSSPHRERTSTLASGI